MDDLYYAMFLEETKEQIQAIEQELLILEQGQGDTETINSIFRMAHSIKGASATMGFDDMTTLSHHLENLLSRVRAKEIHVDTQVMNTFFKSIDALQEIHLGIQERRDSGVDIESIVAEIQEIIQNKKHQKIQFLQEEESLPEENEVEEAELELTEGEASLCQDIDKRLHIYKVLIEMDKTAKMKSVKSFLIVNNLLGIGDIIATSPENYEQVGDESFGDLFSIIMATEREHEIIYKNINTISEIKHIYMKKVREGKEEQLRLPDNVRVMGSSQGNARREDRATVRVDVNKIDKLLNLVGEFIIDKENLNQIGAALKRKYKNDPLIQKLNNILPHINSIGSEMQETVMSTRMLPLEHIFNRFPRMVRDLAQRCNKEIQFEIEGKETEIDRGIIEELIDPLTHILRNAVDHGFEETEERLKKNKNPTGTLRLSARHEESSVVIEIKDDGKGIDAQRIREKVLEKALATSEHLKLLSDTEVIHYIFEPGFSTAKEISDISGRGVGLDVVKSNIGKLNGMVDVKTVLGEGTRFVIKLPLTLAIIQALLIREDEYVFALPISSIIETIRLKGNQVREEIHEVGGLEIFDWREQAIPVIRIGKYFDIQETKRSDKLFIVIVGHSERKFALVVNKLVGEQEVVIKSIGDFIGKNKLFGNVQGISGVSILGDGSFAQIIDVAAISRRMGG
ncbi:hypothetical protein Gferi_09340 [Geosporobacter ferrireducens]|uniref:Chemotaxis protein CheA n=2 Tax=Geosporobacter ferrireducens TaxID=1424294 RepID=A0A1D8GQC0_9FIRM|nr:hypothetical protein Gferi_09340 [Geosporobacter ferrireducens]